MGKLRKVWAAKKEIFQLFDDLVTDAEDKDLTPLEIAQLETDIKAVIAKLRAS